MKVGSWYILTKLLDSVFSLTTVLVTFLLSKNIKVQKTNANLATSYFLMFFKLWNYGITFLSSLLVRT